MGTTLDALQAGSASYAIVVGIEGYRYLLTDWHDPSAAAAAWSGVSDGDWDDSAIGGLYIELSNSQTISPYDPLTSGGTCVLRIAADPNASEPDRFGIDLHRRNYGARTELTASLPRDESAGMPVQDTALFPSSGVVYVGTEAIRYESKLSYGFVGLQRGKWSPFAAGGSETTRFAQHHRVIADPQAAILRPRVTEVPCTWIGKWVGVYLHRVVNGVLDTRDQAQCVFAGRIAETGDDPATGCSVLHLKHALDYIKETSIGRDMWSAEVQAGIYIREDEVFYAKDRIAANTVWSEADTLVVKTGAPTNTNEMQAGLYTLDRLCSTLTAWLQGEEAAGRLNHFYNFASPVATDDGPRTVLWWESSGSASQTARFGIACPPGVAEFLGWPGSGLITDENQGGDTHELASPVEPLQGVFQGTAALRIYLSDLRGTIVDQSATLPSGCIGPVPSPGPVGIFLLDEQFLFWGRLNGDFIDSCQPLRAYGETQEVADLVTGYRISAGKTNVRIRQVLIFETSEANLLKWLLLSTGSAGYNDPNFDVLGYGLGLGLPAGICSNLKTSIDALPASDASLICILDKTRNFADVLKGDLALRRAFTRWKNQSLEFATWEVPTSASSVAELGEETKAAPTGTRDDHRTSSIETSEWAKPIVKIQYNRDITNQASGDGYASTVTLEDAAAVDDVGGDAPAITIKAENTYSQFALTGFGIEALIPGYLATFPLFSRPKKYISRSIDPRYWEGLSVGDTVTITDAFARDPATGRRGTASRPAFVTSHKYTLGGRTPSSNGEDAASPGGGEIQAFYLDVATVYAYGPAADVDETQANAGYNAGTKTLTCKAHSYSEASADADATWFDVGDRILIQEVDPSGAPLSWGDVVAAQSGNTITLTTGLSSPAWDTTKRYRVRFDEYNATALSQRSHAFEADDVNGGLDGDPPHQYTVGQAEGVYTQNTPGGPVELISSSVSDGSERSRDVGFESALVHLVNSTIDYKTATSSPHLIATAVNGSTIPGGSTWMLVTISPIYLGGEALSNPVNRTVAVAPLFRSTDGSTAICRITISRTPPLGDSIYDVDRGSMIGDREFTTTSTTFSTPSTQPIVASLKSPDGTAWVYLEVSTKAETYGIAQLALSPRIVT